MSAHDDTIRSLIACCSAGFCVTATGSDVKTWSLVGGGMMNAHHLRWVRRVLHDHGNRRWGSSVLLLRCGVVP